MHSQDAGAHSKTRVAAIEREDGKELAQRKKMIASAKVDAALAASDVPYVLSGKGPSQSLVTFERWGQTAALSTM